MFGVSATYAYTLLFKLIDIKVYERLDKRNK